MSGERLRKKKHDKVFTNIKRKIKSPNPVTEGIEFTLQNQEN